MVLDKLLLLAPERGAELMDSPLQGTKVDKMLCQLDAVDAPLTMKANLKSASAGFAKEIKVDGKMVKVKDPLDPNSNALAVLFCFETMDTYAIPLRKIKTRADGTRVVVENVRTWLPPSNIVKVRSLQYKAATARCRCTFTAAGAARLLDIAAEAATIPPVGTVLPSLGAQ